MTTTLTEIQAKCSPELIASGDVVSMAAAVSAGRTQIVEVPVEKVQKYLMGGGQWWPIKAAAATVASAEAVLDVCASRLDAIDTTLTIVTEMLNGLVAANLITQIDMNNLLAMAVVPAPVTIYDIAVALRGY